MVKLFSENKHVVITGRMVAKVILISAMIAQAVMLALACCGFVFPPSSKTVLLLGLPATFLTYLTAIHNPSKTINKASKE
ncbi:hypothetical protein [Bifidobacterium oedipodis]|uniref:hypothetical protein n=1 Tax=Bifidobacterium oedipodis TaxID=2675322 RepID=UPI00145C6464|nr:hypothetical protein [Bifidobacterium sp. DSM 109957]